MPLFVRGADLPLEKGSPLQRGRRFVALGAAAVLVALLLPTTTASAQAATNYAVEVGGRVPRGESMRFFPSSISVHDGDTLTFMGGFHTATLLPSETPTGQPARTDVQNWIDENASGIGEPYEFFALDPDDGPAETKANNAVVFGPTDCGTAAAPCSFDGSEVVNSGLLFFSDDPSTPAFEGFTAEVNGDAGDVFWAVCLVHPHMRMKITIVADGAAATTQEAIDSAKATTLAADTDLAQAVHSRLNTRRSKHKLADGTVVWDAWSGYDTHHVSLYGMYPKTLNVRKGDRVRWHFSQLVNEIHTVTFPLAQGLEIANEGFTFWCDPDGDSGSGPDTQAAQAPPFCADPAELEIDFPGEFSLPSGNGRVTSKTDFENSAVRGATAPTSSSYTLRFPAVSGKTPFKYVCLVHSFMRGKVAVRR